jgi:hypothetical protein
MAAAPIDPAIRAAGNRVSQGRADIPDAEIRTSLKREFQRNFAVFNGRNGLSSKKSLCAALSQPISCESDSAAGRRNGRIFVAPTKIMYDYLWSRAIIIDL